MNCTQCIHSYELLLKKAAKKTLAIWNLNATSQVERKKGTRFSSIEYSSNPILQTRKLDWNSSPRLNSKTHQIWSLTSFCPARTTFILKSMTMVGNEASPSYLPSTKRLNRQVWLERKIHFSIFYSSQIRVTIHHQQRLLWGGDY